MSINILSFDPSLNNWGYALLSYNKDTQQLILEQCGVISPPKCIKTLPKQNQKDIAIANNLYTQLVDKVTQANVWVAEVPYASQNSRGLVSNALCFGVLGSMLTYNSNFIQVHPYDVKKHIGNRTTDKQQIIDWVKEHHKNTLHLIPQAKSKAEHICDAIVACHVAIQTKQFKELIHENHIKPTRT